MGRCRFCGRAFCGSHQGVYRYGNRASDECVDCFVQGLSIPAPEPVGLTQLEAEREAVRRLRAAGVPEQEMDVGRAQIPAGKSLFGTPRFTYRRYASSGWVLGDVEWFGPRQDPFDAYQGLTHIDRTLPTVLLFQTPSGFGAYDSHLALLDPATTNGITTISVRKGNRASTEGLLLAADRLIERHAAGS